MLLSSPYSGTASLEIPRRETLARLLDKAGRRTSPLQAEVGNFLSRYAPDVVPARESARTRVYLFGKLAKRFGDAYRVGCPALAKPPHVRRQ